MKCVSPAEEHADGDDDVAGAPGTNVANTQSMHDNGNQLSRMPKCAKKFAPRGWRLKSFDTVWTAWRMVLVGGGWLKRILVPHISTLTRVHAFFPGTYVLKNAHVFVSLHRRKGGLMRDDGSFLFRNEFGGLGPGVKWDI